MCCAFFHHHLDYQSKVVHSLYHLQLALNKAHLEHLEYKNSHMHLASEMIRLKLRLEHQYDFMKELTTISKQNYIRIKGIPEEELGSEEKQSMIEEKVYDLAKYIGITDITIKDVERASRVGKPILSKKSKLSARMIVAEISSLKIKTQFIEQASKSLRNTGFFVYDFLSTMDMVGVDKPVESIVNKEEQAEHAELHADHNCGYIKEIKEPKVIAKASKTFGAWLQDPKGLGERVWVIDNFNKNYFIEEYATIKDLQNKRLRRKIKLPIYFAGTGHVIYDNNLYFNKFNTSSLVKFDLNKLRIVKEVDVTGAVFGNMASYSWQGHTDFDLNLGWVGNFFSFSIFFLLIHILRSCLEFHQKLFAQQ